MYCKIPDESHTLGLVHEETYRGMPANLTFDLPKGMLKNAGTNHSYECTRRDTLP